VLYAFAVVLAAGLVLALVNGLLLSRSFLRRVDAINDTCRSIMAGRLEERIAIARGGDEFDRLGASINDMLDRIQALMESLRQVSNDIAHDMRTPLTHLRHRLERIQDEATTTTEYAAAVEDAVSECDKLLGVFTALLRIAQIEAGARRAEFREIDFAALVGKARDIYAPVMDDAGHPFLVHAGQVPPVRGDEQLLLQLIANLLDNTLAHTPDGCEIALDCTAEKDAVILSVADRGPGIAPGELEKVLRRFYRCEQSRTKPGSGLGLALAAAVAQLHEAELTLADNAPGLRASLRFSPITPAAAS
jgi:signal transduction histidine kinase